MLLLLGWWWLSIERALLELLILNRLGRLHTGLLVLLLRLGRLGRKRVHVRLLLLRRRSPHRIIGVLCLRLRRWWLLPVLLGSDGRSVEADQIIHHYRCRCVRGWWLRVRSIAAPRPIYSLHAGEFRRRNGLSFVG